MSELPHWQHDLPREVRENLAGMLDFSDIIPATARPAPLTIQPAPPPAAAPPSSAERLQRATSGKIGLVQVSVDETPHPLWLRAGTDDATAALAALTPRPGGLKIPYNPRRILEIGAGAGYRSVALALAYPGAEILTTEANATFQRIALLNTLPYRNITCAFITASTDTARYAFSGRQGPAGRPALTRDDAGTITAIQLKNFTYSRNWAVYDTVVITPDAASDHLLRAPWPNSVRLIAVETGGAPLHEATAACFPADKFLTTMQGDFVLLHRRTVDATPLPPRLHPIFIPEGPAQIATLENLPADPPGFFSFGMHGFRLHANASGAPVATLTVAAIDRNFTELHLALRAGHVTANPIRFTVKILAPDEILSAAEVLKGGETRSVIIPLPPHDGPCEVVFATEMAEFGDSNASAWAEFLSTAFA
jgi:hypothetical protein